MADPSDNNALGAALVATLQAVDPDALVSYDDDPSLQCGKHAWLLRPLSGARRVDQCVYEKTWILAVYSPLDCDDAAARRYVYSVLSETGALSARCALLARPPQLAGMRIEVGQAGNFGLATYKSAGEPNVYYGSIPFTIRYTTQEPCT